MECEKCQSKDLQVVKYEISNGSIQLRWQCKECGYVHLPSIKHSNFTKEEYDKIPYLDEMLRQSFYQKQEREREEKRIEAEKRYEEHRKEGFNKLTEYYKTTEWQEKRIMRLNLNKTLFDGWCERCGKHLAIHVHHRNYNIIDGLEHPFDLEALCEDCHKKLHPHMED